MGRFYKATPAQFIDDKMFELDSTAMMKATETVDANIDKVYDRMEDADALLKVKRLAADDEFTRGRIQGYEGEIGGISDSMYNDVLGYKKHGQTMRGVSRKISSDLNNGALGSAEKQFEDDAAYNAKLDNNKKISGTRKDLAKRVTTQRYKEKGSLDWQEDGTHNNIADGQVEVLEEFDIDTHLNTLASGWEADQEATAYAKENGSYISTGGTTTKERKEAEITDYLTKGLVSSGWDAKQRQIFEMQNELGELPEGETVESMMEKAQNNFIDQGKAKLGFKQEAKRANKVANPTRNDKFDPNNPEEGDYNIEVRDYNVNRADSKIVDEKNHMLEDLANVSGRIDPTLMPEYIISSSLTKGGTDNSTTNLARLRKLGKFTGPEGKKAFINYINNAKAQKTNMIPVVDAAIVNTINGKGTNQAIKKVTKITSDGTRVEMKYETLGAMIEDPSSNVFLIPSTGTSTFRAYKRDAEGYLVDKDNVRLKGENAVDITKPEDYSEMASRNRKLSAEKTKQADYNIDFNLLKAKAGKLKYKRVPTLGQDDKITWDESYVMTYHFTQIDKTTGEVSQFETEVEIEPSDVNQKVEQ